MSRSKLILVRKHTHQQCLCLIDTLTQWSKYYYDIWYTYMIQIEIIFISRGWRFMHIILSMTEVGL